MTSAVPSTGTSGRSAGTAGRGAVISRAATRRGSQRAGISRRGRAMNVARPFSFGTRES